MTSPRGTRDRAAPPREPLPSPQAPAQGLLSQASPESHPRDWFVGSSPSRCQVPLACSTSPATLPSVHSGQWCLPGPGGCQASYRLRQAAPFRDPTPPNTMGNRGACAEDTPWGPPGVGWAVTPTFPSLTSRVRMARWDQAAIGDPQQGQAGAGSWRGWPGVGTVRAGALLRPDSLLRVGTGARGRQGLLGSLSR